MFVSRSYGIDGNNHLTFGGIDVCSLAAEYGTPLYIMDENEIRENCRVYKNAVDEYYGGKGLILYASKAFACKEIYRIVSSEGMGADVVSGGELYTALAAGMDPGKICMHGNNKTADEIKMALGANVGRIVVDNEYELELLDKMAGEMGKKPRILFRIKPGIEAHTHEFIKTGQIDSKFGVALENGEAHGIVLKALKMPNVEVVGVHCHIGSQIFDVEPFALAAEKLVNFIGDIKDEAGYEMKELNLGGGFGVMYTSEDDPIEFDKFIESVSRVVKETSEKRKVEHPFILMEPGRSIVGTAGATLYTVGAVKDIPGIRKYVSVDGGMGDNPRHIMYGSRYEAVVANKAGDKPCEVVTIAGRCCESGDILVRDIILPKIEVGDIIAVMTTGAYNYSMASNYNRIPRPAVVMIKDGKARLAVRRESYEDLVKNDI